MSPKPARGLYFLASDTILPWSVAFLESLRRFNPDLPAYIIPFDDSSPRAIELARRYGVEVFQSPHFAALEEIGRSVGAGKVSYGHHWFRRFAAFSGPLDEFIYLDGRTLVLTDLLPIIASLGPSGADLLHYDLAPEHVYLPGPLHEGFMRQGRGRGFLSGLWVSRRDALTLDEMQRFAAEAVTADVGPQLNRRNSDQCFLNYCCDAKPLRVRGMYEVIPGLVSECWAAIPGVYSAPDGYRRWNHGGLEHNFRVPFLHWAGQHLGPGMPHRSLYLQFATRPLSPRLCKKLTWAAAAPFYRTGAAMRRNRRANLIYHHLKCRLLGTPLPAALTPHRHSIDGKVPSSSAS